MAYMHSFLISQDEADTAECNVDLSESGIVRLSITTRRDGALVDDYTIHMTPARFDALVTDILNARDTMCARMVPA